MEYTPPPAPVETGVTFPVHRIPQPINQLQQGISNLLITDYHIHNTQISTGFLCYDHHGQLLEGRFCISIKPDDPDYLAEGDIYELSGFYVIHNSRQRKLTHLLYYIWIDQATRMLKVPDMGPIFPVQIFSPQNYESLLRLAITPTYLPGRRLVKLILCNKQAADFSTLQRKKDRKFKAVIFTSIIPKISKGKLQLNSSPATNFYFNKSIEYIKHFKG